MMHKACTVIEEVPYCFSRSSIKFQGQTGQKIADFDPNWAFPDCNSSLNWPMALKWCKKLKSLTYHRRGALLFLKVICQISRSHGTNNRRFGPNWAFPDCNSRLNSLMALKWCTKLEVAWKRCPNVFQGHPSNVKVTQDRKSQILTRIEHFRTVIPVCIHRWLWKDAKNLK